MFRTNVLSIEICNDYIEYTFDYVWNNSIRIDNLYELDKTLPVEYIEIELNSELTWQKDYLHGYTNLKSIHIEGSCCRRLNNINALDYLPKVSELRLCNIGMDYIPQTLIHDNLKSLDLSHNVFEVLLFPHNSSLESLTMTNCELKYISGIQSLKNVEYLSLDDNSIADISLLRFGSYKMISLQSNRIRDVSPLRSCMKLTTLYIDDNYLKHEDNIELLPDVNIIRHRLNEYSVWSV